jgi:hypothetical protein
MGVLLIAAILAGASMVSFVVLSRVVGVPAVEIYQAVPADDAGRNHGR